LKETIMGKILVHEFTTVDGVVDEPKWTMAYGFDPKMGETIGSVMGACKALLLGRRTFEMFAPAWSVRTAEDDPGAPFFNESPKYVVSSTLQNAEWNNSIYVSGSGTLVRAMLADGLVDELHLFVYPLALGSGQRLFADGGPSAKFGLAQADRFENGVMHLGYTTE
jgi:dihydrofolate reductase